MNRSSTVMILGENIRGESWRIVVDCGRGLNRSATVAGSGSFLAAPWVESWPFLGVQMNRGESWYY